MLLYYIKLVFEPPGYMPVSINQSINQAQGLNFEEIRDAHRPSKDASLTCSVPKGARSASEMQGCIAGLTRLATLYHASSARRAQHLL